MNAIKYCCFLVVCLFSCTPLLHVTTTPNAKQKWKQHKKIAIIPFKIFSNNQRYRLTDKELIEEQGIMKDLSHAVQLNMYAVLQNQFTIGNLSVVILHPDTTTKLLAQSGITYGNIPEKNINVLCQILNVDAVIAGTIDFNRFVIPTNYFKFFSFQTLENAEIYLSIFDKYVIAPIFYINDITTAKDFEKYKRARSVNGINEQYLIVNMFDKAMKALPYVIKSPLKRNY
jgi:hypothetical protein